MTADNSFAEAIAEQLEFAAREPLDPQALGMRRRGRVEAERRVRERREAEYHQARVLLLVNAMSGDRGSLNGLTKLAKLDFLLRYPTFLLKLVDAQGDVMPPELVPSASERVAVESRMIRYKYGPWDERYYGVLGSLVGRGLLEHEQAKNGALILRLTPGGRAIAAVLGRDPAWKLVVERCEFLKERFGRLSGNSLKELIYQQLPEVVDRPHRAEI